MKVKFLKKLLPLSTILVATIGVPILVASCGSTSNNSGETKPEGPEVPQVPEVPNSEKIEKELLKKISDKVNNSNLTLIEKVKEYDALIKEDLGFAKTLGINLIKQKFLMYGDIKDSKEKINRVVPLDVFGSNRPNATENVFNDVLREENVLGVSEITANDNQIIFNIKFANENKKYLVHNSPLDQSKLYYGEPLANDFITITIDLSNKSTYFFDKKVFNDINEFLKEIGKNVNHLNFKNNSIFIALIKTNDKYNLALTSNYLTIGNDVETLKTTSAQIIYNLRGNIPNITSSRTHFSWMQLGNILPIKQ